MAAKMAVLHIIEGGEAVAFGNMGLLQAARSFHPQSGVPFLAWAAIRVRGAILDAVRSDGTAPKSLCSRRGGAEKKAERLTRHLAGMRSASDLGVVATSVDAGDERAPSPEKALIDAEEQVRLRRAIARLPPVERSIVEAHYFEGETLEDASHGIGRSKSWGSRLHAQALRRLRKELARSDGECVPLSRRWPVAC
jgi:RNA polymerase sigma factor for flagellar operon FliA